MRRSATITVDPMRGVRNELRVATSSAAPRLVLTSPEFFVSDTYVYLSQKLLVMIRRFHLLSHALARLVPGDHTGHRSGRLLHRVKDRESGLDKGLLSRQKIRHTCYIRRGTQCHQDRLAGGPLGCH